MQSEDLDCILFLLSTLNLKNYEHWKNIESHSDVNNTFVVASRGGGKRRIDGIVPM